MSHPSAPTTPCGHSPVRRRLTLYLSGFDPQGPAHYHQLYTECAAQQSKVSGDRCVVGKRRKDGPHRAWWNVEYQTSGPEPETTETRYEFLRWDDIVRQHWPRGRTALLKSTGFATVQMWRNGVMWQALKTSWPMFVAIALPGLLMLVLGLLLLGLLGGAALWVGQGHSPAVAAVGVLLGVLALGGVGLEAERRSHMAWLMRSLACLVRQGRGQTPELDQRLDHFAEHLVEQVGTGHWDEILVVGHSSGAMMAMIVMARALSRLACDATRTPEHHPRPSLALLTLGHCAPLLTEQPEAQGFRDEVRCLATADDITWIDYGAPPDGCCFPLVHPAAAAMKHDWHPSLQPKLINPRFAQLFSPEAYHEIRKDKFRCHFQYLMANEQSGLYDYVALTAGTLSLAARHAEAASITDFRLFQVWGGPRR